MNPSHDFYQDIRGSSPNMITKDPETSQQPTNYQSPIPRLSRLAAETATALRRVLRVPIAARAISELLVTRYLSFHAVTIMEGVSNGPIPSNAGLLIAKCLGLFPQLWSDHGHVQYDISFLLAYAYTRTGYYLTSLTNVDALRHVDPSAWALTPRCEVK